MGEEGAETGKALTKELVAGQLTKVSRTADGRGFTFINLDVSGQELAEIAAVGEYPHLRQVNMKTNLIKDLTPLVALKHLVVLDVSENQIANLDSLNGEDVLPHCK